MVQIRSLGALALAAALAAGCGGDSGNDAEPKSQAGGAGGASRQKSRTLAEAVGQSADLGQFNRAAEAAGLGQVLRGGSYTLFAPVNAAFDRLPEESRNRLMAEEGREQLRQLLAYHMVPGVVTVEDIGRAIQRGQGRAVMATTSGGTLTFSREGETLFVTDAAGGRARVSQPDQIQTNGVVHHIDAVLMPAGSEPAAAE
jgi:uncharacterized surface protein with fasciclin (FAS1) repeats